MVIFHHRQHFFHGGVHTDKHRAAHEAVADVQLHQMRHGKQRRQILTGQSVTGVHLQAEQVRLPRPSDEALQFCFTICRSRRQEARINFRFLISDFRFSQSLLTSAATDDDELQRLIAGAQQAHSLGLQVNAGHGLTCENLPALFAVPHLVELNIGHSLVSRAVFTGMDAAVKEMLAVMKKYRG